MGYVGTATDIHERKEMEEKLSRAAAADHEVAEVLQRSLLPESLPAIDGVEIEARYLPASRGAAIGGDWYDAIELEDGRVEVVVGDVVGHGLRAATVMGQLRNAFRAYALVETSPAQTLVRLNRLLAKDGRDLMATALCIAIDRDTGEIEVASAGHPPPLVIESGGRAYFIEEGRSVPLGTADPAPYTESKTRLEPGSTLILYTDGLVERRDTSLDDRLAQLATVASVADGELGDVCDQLLEGSLGGKRPADDVAVLAIRLELTEPGRLSLRLPADPAALAQLRRRLGRFLEAAGAEEGERFEITLTVCEAAANAIEHAYGPGDAEFELDARTDGELVQISVRDFGVWRERRGEDRGRGLTIMEGMMDEVEVSRTSNGTTVRMSRRLGVARGGMSTNAELGFERHELAVVATLAGEVDMTNAEFVRDQITAQVPNDAHALVIDLSATQYLDSAAIELLFELSRRLGRRRQQLRLVVPESSPLTRLLTLTDVGSVAPVHSELAEALSSA